MQTLIRYSQTCTAGINGVGWCENLPGRRPGSEGRVRCHKDYGCNPGGRSCSEEDGIVKCGDQTETRKVLPVPFGM
ncbi:unnamed protein product [Clonostachys chloroleuca]|uniref:Uncharacterized protein n=1 Tax=Clonostachys chloroleuca TaxID=1926264 RepID=A0AA35MJ46_9HYPO|nr:unnamed protein product [Clonostachys chloroleuca]